MPGLEPFSQFAQSYGITKKTTINTAAELKQLGSKAYDEAYEDAKKAYAKSQGLPADFTESDAEIKAIEATFKADQLAYFENFVSHNFDAIAALDGTSGLSEKDLQLLDEQSKTGVMIAKSKQAFGDLDIKPVTSFQDAKTRWNSNITEPNGRFNQYAFTAFGLHDERSFNSVKSADGNPNDFSNQDLMLVQAEYSLNELKTALPEKKAATAEANALAAETKADEADKKATEKEKAAEVAENEAKAAEKKRDEDKPLIAKSNLTDKKKIEYTEIAEGRATEARKKADDLKTEARALRAEAIRLRAEANQARQAAEKAKPQGINFLLPTPDVKSASLNK